MRVEDSDAVKLLKVTAALILTWAGGVGGGWCCEGQGDGEGLACTPDSEAPGTPHTVNYGPEHCNARWPTFDRQCTAMMCLTIWHSSHIPYTLIKPQDLGFSTTVIEVELRVGLSCCRDRDAVQAAKDYAPVKKVQGLIGDIWASERLCDLSLDVTLLAICDDRWCKRSFFVSPATKRPV